MKNSLLIFFLLISTSTVFGKEVVITIPYDSLSGKYGYSEVVEFELGLNETFTNIKNWLLLQHPESNFPVDELDSKIVDNRSVSFVSALSILGMKTPITNKVNYDIIIEFRDGRYKYTITNIIFEENPQWPSPEQTLETFVLSHLQMGLGKRKMRTVIEDTCEILHEEIEKDIANLKKAARSQAVKDEW